MAAEAAGVTVRRSIVDALRAEGVEVVFALMGDANMELVSEMAGRGGMRVVFGRHEQGVVSMQTATRGLPGGLGWRR